MSIEKFWQDIQQSEQQWVSMTQQEIMQAVNKQLQTDHLDIVAEVAASTKKTYCLIFTAQGDVESFEIILEIVKQAPELQYFEIEAFRQRQKTMGTFSMQHEGKDFQLSPEDILIEYHESYRKIALEISFKKVIPEELMEHVQTMTFIILDHILGEYDFAVKVGAVEFVERPRINDSIPLDQFTEVFDHFWSTELLHTGEFIDQPDNWQTTMLELTNPNDPEDKLLVQRNETANLLVGRADLCYCLTISADVDSKDTLSHIYTLEDKITNMLLRNEQGMHCQNILGIGFRNMQWQIENKEAIATSIEHIIAEFPMLNTNISIEFDPQWSDYLRWVE